MNLYQVVAVVLAVLAFVLAVLGEEVAGVLAICSVTIAVVGQARHPAA